ncbi:MAG TPA: NADH-quinone oxidoreductase subunit C [Acidimicrobiales bacterium]|nr:NADH-quinone oxidoreductase subunit C [Acidimicrobiales bacterium]
MTTVGEQLEQLVANRPPRATLRLPATDLVATASTLLAAGYRLALIAAVETPGPIRIEYLFTDGPPDQRIELEVEVDRGSPRIPSLARVSFPAGRFEREMRDLFGIEPIGHPQPRPLVLHQHWTPGWHPMRSDAGPQPPMLSDAAPYPFIRVEGSGVYEIPVGPVHAGLIEPGHFRFSVVGETIVKMKARLWFVHKGIERLFEGRDATSAVTLAEKISGDTAVGHCLAYAQAVEEALAIEVTPRGNELRAVLLELERLYNHVADVGALCNDAGFGLANAHALTLREQLLRLNESVTGHRLLRGGVTLGGASLVSLPQPDQLREVGDHFRRLTHLARSNTIVMDRFTGTATLSAEQAMEIGVLGVVARASGLCFDSRSAHPFVDSPVTFRPACRDTGDVLARFLVRCDEVAASLDLLSDYVARTGPLTDVSVDRGFKSAGHGSGIVEGWRGTIVHRVEVGPGGMLERVKVVDPSFLTWPALPVALADTIVPDFPLANKSFNLSYAGNDL